MAKSPDKLLSALTQWRDSLVNLSGRNKLLNYRATRSSTIDFTRNAPEEVLALIGAKGGAFTVGTRPPVVKASALLPGDEEPSLDLEDLVLAGIQEFDYSLYPNSLFADMTQKEADRALRNLDGYSKREYLDKGLNTLYVAFGALRWIDDSGDSRLSPLVLVPVQLIADGPKQPLKLSLSEEDLATNPALNLKMLEYGIKLPASEVVKEVWDAEGLRAALSLFSSLKWEEGWATEEFAVLTNFMFAKEAMYRDLLENEALILEHLALQALAGEKVAVSNSFQFDPVDDDEIDAVAAPEVTPLILSADSSQRAAIEAARAGRSFVLDGPPGTGKSQTIANIIGTLIADGKSVLFVSEKAVALDVVRDRLAPLGLGPFVFELHSHKAVRSEVAKGLGKALAQIPSPPATASAMTREEASRLRKNLSEYAEAMNEIRPTLGQSVFSVIGRISSLTTERLAPTPGDVAGLDQRTLAEIELLSHSLSRNWKVLLEGGDSLWFGLVERRPMAFRVDQALASLASLQGLNDAVGDVAQAFELVRPSEAGKIAKMLATWNDGRTQEHVVTSWLTKYTPSEVEAAVDEYSKLQASYRQAVESLEEVCSIPNKSIPRLDPGRVPPLETLEAAFTAYGSLELRELPALRGYCDRTLEIAGEIEQSSNALTTALGLKPALMEDIAAIIRSSTALLDDYQPLPDWLADSGNLARLVQETGELRDSLTAEADARAEASGSFSDALLDLPVPEIAERLKRNSTWYRRFGREYREDKATIVGVASSSFKVALRRIDVAVAWHTRNRARLVLEARTGPQLGPKYLGLDSDWGAIERALDNAQIVATDGLVNDLDQLRLTVAAKADLNSLRRELEELRTIYRLWNDLHSSTRSPLDTEFASGRIAALMLRIAEAGKVVSEIAEFLAPIAALGMEQITLKGALELIVRRHEVAVIESKYNEVVPGYSAILGDLPPSAGINTLTLESALSSKLNWLKELAADVGLGNDGVILSNKQFDSLSNAYLPAGLVEAELRWKELSADILSAFTELRQTELAEDLDDYRAAREVLEAFANNPDGAAEWFDAETSRNSLSALGLKAVVDHAVSQGIPQLEVSDYILRAVLSAWLDLTMAEDPRISGDPNSRADIVKRFRDLDQALVDGAIGSIIQAGVARRPRSQVGQAAIISREAEKKKRHMPVRSLVDQARDVIQAIHPCFMMSPLAVSQYLPADLNFDVVIFDEASQVTPGDAINCIYRGKALIAAGDQRQLPPTSFFAASLDDDGDDADEENYATDYESVLDLMKGSGAFVAQTLRWHYRSRHEHLIAYSNASFYDSRLITFPGAINESDDLGVKYIKSKGVYRRSSGQDNPVEALDVADRVMHHFKTRPGKTLGVVAFSAAQRDTILNAIELKRADFPELDSNFDGDRISGFFVKSLESVQGDERDVIIFSTGYGKDEFGKMYRNFGPLTRKGGERRLNVAVTRAKELVELVTSMTSADIGDAGSEGARHLRRYLDFAERGPAALMLELGPEGLGTDSPFEDSVIAAIRSWGYEVQPQVGVAGYRIDIGVKHPSLPGAFMLGIECDGAMYHSSKSARDRDRLRHEVLGGLGWDLHHIWGTAWYRNREREMSKLQNLLEELANSPVIGRVVKSDPSATISRVAPNFEFEFESPDLNAPPDWAKAYVRATPPKISKWLDFADEGSSWQMVDWVKAIVAVESPIAAELVSTRFREATGVGRVGSRIQLTISAAIRRSKVRVDANGFLWSGPQDRVSVRTPGDGVERAIELVATEEIGEAIRRTVEDSAGASRDAVASHVARVFGWHRKSAQITTRIRTIIDGQVELGVIEESSAGLRISK